MDLIDFLGSAELFFHPTQDYVLGEFGIRNDRIAVGRCFEADRTVGARAVHTVGGVYGVVRGVHDAVGGVAFEVGDGPGVLNVRGVGHSGLSSTCCAINGFLEFWNLVFHGGVTVVFEDYFACVAGPRGHLGDGDPRFNPATDCSVAAIVGTVEVGN